MTKNPWRGYAVLEGTTIEQSAFENARVATVTMPSTLRTIGSQAHLRIHLTSLTLPDSWRGIGHSHYAEADERRYWRCHVLPDGAFALRSQPGQCEPPSGPRQAHDARRECPVVP